MTKIGKHNTLLIFTIICYFFLCLPLMGQTGYNNKIMVSEPSKDIHWKSIGKIFSSTYPKFKDSHKPGVNGSGTMISPRLFLTAGHAIQKKNVQIDLAGITYSGDLIALDLYHDRALIKLREDYEGPIKELRKEVARDGETFKSYGYGKGYGYHNILYLNGVFYGDAYFGDSGGPLIDQNGKIVCMVLATWKDDKGKANIFSMGHESLYEWVERNKNNNFLNPVIDDE